MTDVKALVERLRESCGLSSLDEERNDAADALEAQAAEIRRLREEMTKIASGRYDWHAMRTRAALALTEGGADAQPPALTGEEKG